MKLELNMIAAFGLLFAGATMIGGLMAGGAACVGVGVALIAGAVLRKREGTE